MKFLEPSLELKAKAKSQIYADMAPGFFLVHFKILSSLFIGGVLALLICAQFGNGLSEFARIVYHSIHECVGKFGCAVISSISYIGFSLGALQFLSSSKMQFKIILSQHSFKIVAWIIAVGILLGRHGQHDNDFLTVTLWILIAGVTTIAFQRLQRSRLFETTVPR